MKNKVIFFLTALIAVVYCTMIFGEIGNRIVAATNNIPIAFTEGDAGSEALLCGTGRFAIHNSTESGADIAWGIGTASTAPSADSGPIPNGASYNGKLIAPNQTIYLRSLMGWAANSGDVHVVCEGIF